MKEEPIGVRLLFVMYDEYAASALIQSCHDMKKTDNFRGRQCILDL